MLSPPPSSTLFPYTTLFRSLSIVAEQTCSLVIPSHPFPWRQWAELLHQKIDHRSHLRRRVAIVRIGCKNTAHGIDRKSTRLNSSHQIISYAVFCLKKKNITK